MNYKLIIRKIKTELILSEYYLDEGDEHKVKEHLHKIRKLVPTVTGGLTVRKKPIRRSTK